MNWSVLQQWITSETDFCPLIDKKRSVSGGCINQAYLVPTSCGSGLFIKINSAENIDLFEAETAGLNQLQKAGAIRVPEAYGYAIADNSAFLVMEAIDLHSWQDADHQSRLGVQLGQLHTCTAPDGTFGNTYDNHIGRTPQKNTPLVNWTEFFISQRIDFQLQLAAKNGWNFTDREKLNVSIRNIFDQTPPPTPSLLHGDLWSGNAAFDESENPVIFDPACYYGDREAEIAFTKMFGGFSPAFYRSYREIHPAPENEALLHRLYNLYHELNHYNLFGGGYGQQAQGTIQLICGS